MWTNPGTRGGYEDSSRIPRHKHKVGPWRLLLARLARGIGDLLLDTETPRFGLSSLLNHFQHAILDQGLDQGRSVGMTKLENLTRNTTAQEKRLGCVVLLERDTD